MKVYGSNAIRNEAFVGHGASGKTSLVDALAFVSGASRRHAPSELVSQLHSESTRRGLSPRVAALEVGPFRLVSRELPERRGLANE
jgi:translation elongation factor EF-G